MPRSNRELRAALAAIAAISVSYLGVVVFFGSIPRASAFFGHSLGILGFLLMLMTETLYSLRKRSRNARLGRMAEWLQFHIFTGLVGPYLVLLHTSWKFNGLAGVLMLLTVVIVISGVTGRYIYTSVPRTADGAVVEAEALMRQIERIDAQLQGWQTIAPARAILEELYQPAKDVRSQSDFAFFFGRGLEDLRYRLAWLRVKTRLDATTREQVVELEQLYRRQRQLQRQIVSLALARRALAVWHAIHIPIGMALFTIAAIHIAAAIYYATLLK